MRGPYFVGPICRARDPGGTTDSESVGRSPLAGRRSTFPFRRYVHIVVAVGTTIAGHPPHRSVQARLRVRLLSRMSGGKAGIRIRMQNAGWWNPSVQERDETIPSHLGALPGEATGGPGIDS